MNAKALALIVLVALSGVTAIHYSDDLQQVFESWRSGEAKALISLDIKVPQVDADKCMLAVMRYPSMYLPNNGTLEELYIGPASPGSIVTVKKFIPAIPVKTRYDEARGSYIVEYYEPQEFIVMINCVRGNTTVFEFGRNIEVYPRNIVHREEVDIAALAEKYRKESPETKSTSTTQVNSKAGAPGTLRLDDGSVSTPQFNCIVTLDQDSFYYKHGYCYTYVAGPYLYSINGMSTKFGVKGGTPASIIYLDSFSSVKTDFDPNPEVPNWSSSGKNGAYAYEDGETRELTGNSKVRIYFYVQYVYERTVKCYEPNGPCYFFHNLYPYIIHEIYRADSPDIGGSVEPYTPPSTAPSYAVKSYGTRNIYFTPVINSSTPLIGTSIVFSLSVGGPLGPLLWSASLTVNFYQDGRNDNQYTTPYVAISANSSFWYYRWFRDNNAMTYEILFKPCS